MSNFISYRTFRILTALTIALNIYSIQSSGDKSQKLRVLSIRNSHDQHAIEQAASLSLDQTNQNLRRDPEHNATSLTDPSLSLASLNLYESSPIYEKDHNNSKNASNNRTTRNIDAQPDPWSEIKLAKIKPSWLNVSNRFKITSDTIEELDFMVPPEFMLRPAFDSPILLKTKLGIIEGVRSIRFNKQLYTFLSIPYAKPPIGELRFGAPRPIDRWEGILQATKWPPFCVQPSMTLASKSSPVHILTQIMSEDCLYMNIWTPSLKYNRQYRRPVMVWIHGGGFQYGGISVDENDGSALALLGNVVVVTLNYRVSAFGFLNANNQQNAPNNVGLLDQQLALEWVHSNIKQFGGDPQQITLFGESAGGHSVGLHMISPKSHALFKRAILQSGVPTSFLRSYDGKSSSPDESVSSVKMAKRLKCYFSDTKNLSESDTNTDDAYLTTEVNISVNYDDSIATTNSSLSDDFDESTSQPDLDLPILNDATIECLRNKTSLDILKVMGKAGSFGFFPTGRDTKGFFPNGPIQESLDAETLKVGPQKDYIIGTNTDEGTFMLHYGLPNLFPSKEIPKVGNVRELKSALTKELERIKTESSLSRNKSDIASASGSSSEDGDQSRLFKPLLRIKDSFLEGFMPKTNIQVLENGTVIGNTSVYSKEAEFSNSIASLVTDIIFLCPARTLAKTLSDSGRNVYFYIYGHRSSRSQYHSWIGVTHHDEVEFVFGRPTRLADVYSGKDVEMSQRMIKAWSHFAYTGQMPDQLGVKWPKYEGEDNFYMNLVSDKASVGTRYHDRLCNIYDTIITAHLQDI